MDATLIQRTRYVLHSRVRRVQKCNLYLFESSCRELIKWLENHPIISPIIANLTSQEAELRAQLDHVLDELGESGKSSVEEIEADLPTSDNFAAVWWHTVAVASHADELPGDGGRSILDLLHRFLTNGRSFNVADYVEAIRDVAVDGLYEYLDEHLDRRNAIWGLLLKYQQRSEWFRRERLRQFAEVGLEGKSGELGLSVDLNEYILDQGVEFFVEATSASGEADLLLRDPDGRYIVLDAKYLPTGANRSKTLRTLAGGFHQVYRYCKDYSEPEGFLVAFSCLENRIRLELQESDGLPFIKIGGKTVYYLEVHISDEPSASRSGTATEMSFSADELINEIEE